MFGRRSIVMCTDLYVLLAPSSFGSGPVSLWLIVAEHEIANEYQFAYSHQKYALAADGESTCVRNCHGLKLRLDATNGLVVMLAFAR